MQLYIHDLAASIARPVKELKDYRRITLKAGESRQVKFTITHEMLSFYNAEGDVILESGEFDIMIGPNSSDAVLKKARYLFQ